MESTRDELPRELLDKLKSFDASLGEVEEILKPFLKIPITDIRKKISDPLQNAKLDLLVAYVTNSMFWMYLITQGVDPKEHPIKDEIMRIRKHMARVEELQDKKKRSLIDTNAAKRFIRNALWQPSDSTENTESTVEEVEQPSSDKEVKKRKKTSDGQKKKKKKKKKTKTD